MFVFFVALCCSAARLNSRYTNKNIKQIVLPKNAKNGVACDMCKQVVTYIETLLSTTGEEEIITLVEQLCETFPSPYSSLCDSLAEQYVPVIIEWLEQEIEALDICTQIGLCTETKALKGKKNLQRIPRKLILPKNIKNGVACDMCKQVVSYIETLISTAAEEEIIALVEQLCETFPSPYSSICDALAEQYVSVIIDLINQGIEVLDICTNLGLCTESKLRVKRVAPKLAFQKKAILPKKVTLSKNVKNGVACDMCKQVITFVETLFETTAEEEIISLVKQLCETFPSPYSSVCDVIAEQYIPYIIKLIEEGIETLDICSQLGFCTESKQRIQKIQHKLVLPKNKKNGLACDMCTDLVSYIENLLATSGEEEIIALVEEYCNTFEAPYSTLCKAVVEEYVPMIIEWLGQEIEALDICNSLGLCSQTKLKVKRNLRKLVLPKNAKNGVACDMCKQVVTYIETLISTTGEEEIIALVEQLCETFPSPYSSLCDSVVESFVPTIIDLINQGIEALDICTQIGLCTETKLKMKRLPRKLVLPKNAKNGVACDMCKQVVTYIETLISTTGEEEIIALVEQLCETFPSPYSSLCDSVVESFVPTIIDLINQGIEALDICTQIGLCTETQIRKAPRKVNTVKKLAIPQTAVNGVACDMCKQVVTYIETLLSTTGEEEIIALVEQLCETFPSPYSSLCDSLAEQYVPVIIEWLEQEIEALDICTQIGLCTETQEIPAYFRIPSKKRN